MKKPDLLIEALDHAAHSGTAFTAVFYGDALPKDHVYAESLREKVAKLGLGDRVGFHPGVPNTETVAVYGAYDITVNLSTSGMFDKTIFEAMACGSLSLSSNENLQGQIDSRLLYREGDAKDLSEKLSALLALSEDEKTLLRTACRGYAVSAHSLSSLRDRLFDMMSRP